MQQVRKIYAKSAYFCSILNRPR